MASKKNSNKNREILVVATKVKDFIKSKGCMTSSEAIPALSEKIYALLDEATQRTKSNKRSTLKAQDL